jgi:hypothetical protein
VAFPEQAQTPTATNLLWIFIIEISSLQLNTKMLAVVSLGEYRP